MKSALVAAAVLALSGLASEDAQRLRPLPDLDKNPKTGPAVGQQIPLFEITDLNGTRQTFASLRGPKGLVLLFVRSADW